MPEADWCGNHSGKDFDKSEKIASTKGDVLNVPVPEKGVWTLELKVDYTLRPNENYDSDIYICSIENVIADERIMDDALTFEEKIELIKPVVTMGYNYLPVEARSLGGWGKVKEE